MDITQVAERELPLALASQRIDEQLRQLSLSVNEQWSGTNVGSARVTLSRHCGASSQGCGKGLEAEARVGARFEALEHGYVRNFVFGHNMSKRCMYANQEETPA
ncbi:hypothetical protein [Pseudomonas sp. REB1044]|uniref:hypothetical protein n=1 Tax=Pseudomonas sp. REB1044 TaxID=2675224 RepID=UPI00315D3112